MENKAHWENVYETKTPEQVSWTQEIPQTSLDLIASFGLDKTAKIIDIGGGDSNLVDCLLNLGYQNITVLDISEKALERAKKRLGDAASKVNWIVSDVTEFKPEHTFDIWHDRAAFHFLTSPEQIEKYKTIINQNVTGYIAIGTFSDNGPKKCSGLDISQYNEQTIDAQLGNRFEKMNCFTEDHTTPFDTVQNFLFCTFKKL